MGENLIKLTQENFDSVINDSSELVIVDFWAEWCGPCIVLEPVLEDLAKEFGSKIKIGKVNVDEENEIAARYGVFSIPTLLFFKNGKLIETIVGLQKKSKLKKLIENYI